MTLEVGGEGWEGKSGVAGNRAMMREWENIIAGKSSGFCGFLRRYVSQNIVAITGNVQLNRFTLFYVFNW